MEHQSTAAHFSPDQVALHNHISAEVDRYNAGIIRQRLRSVLGSHHTLHGQAEAAFEACTLAGLSSQAAGAATCLTIAMRAETLAKLHGVAVRAASAGTQRATYAAWEADLLKVVGNLRAFARDVLP